MMSAVLVASIALAVVLGYKTKIIATGGVGCVIVPYCRHEMEYDPDLLLKGLAVLWEKNRK